MFPSVRFTRRSSSRLFGLLGGCGGSSSRGSSTGGSLALLGRSRSLRSQNSTGTTQSSLTQIPTVTVLVNDVLQLLQGATWAVLQRNLDGGLGWLGLNREPETRKNASISYAKLTVNKCFGMF